MMGFGFLLQQMGLDPEQVQKAVTDLGETAKTVHATLKRIERNQLAIMKALKIKDIPDAPSNNDEK